MATVTAIEYSGLIWCPTVSTGAFVARRNGKVFITGNSGFPKSLDVSKAIDRAAGAEREVVGIKPNYHSEGKRAGTGANMHGVVDGSFSNPEAAAAITTPATDAALRDALPLLATNPDLAHRRHLLRANKALPVQWHHFLPTRTDPALSHGWIWCYLTGDDIRSAPPWAKPAGWFPTRAIWDFHHSLDATTLLDMADAADDFLNPHLDADPAQDAAADGLLA